LIIFLLATIISFTDLTDRYEVKVDSVTSKEYTIHYVPATLTQKQDKYIGEQLDKVMPDLYKKYSEFYSKQGRSGGVPENIVIQLRKQYLDKYNAEVK